MKLPNKREVEKDFLIEAYKAKLTDKISIELNLKAIDREILSSKDNRNDLLKLKTKYKVELDALDKMLEAIKDRAKELK